MYVECMSKPTVIVLLGLGQRQQDLQVLQNYLQRFVRNADVNVYAKKYYPLQLMEAIKMYSLGWYTKDKEYITKLVNHVRDLNEKKSYVTLIGHSLGGAHVSAVMHELSQIPSIDFRYIKAFTFGTIDIFGNKERKHFGTNIPILHIFYHDDYALKSRRFKKYVTKSNVEQYLDKENHVLLLKYNLTGPVTKNKVHEGYFHKEIENSLKFGLFDSALEKCVKKNMVHSHLHYIHEGFHEFIDSESPTKDKTLSKPLYINVKSSRTLPHSLKVDVNRRRLLSNESGSTKSKRS